MAIKKIKPIGNGRRGMSYVDNSLLSKDKGPKSLRKILTQKAGRSNSGKITVAHRGGGLKRFYRLVNFDFNTNKKAKVVAIKYDPNRAANIALIQYEGGEFDYILAPEKIKEGSIVSNSEDASIRAGNRIAIKNIPVGTQIHNIEILPGIGGKLCRSAGNYGTILSVETGFAQIKLPSGEIRKVADNCLASVGAVGNSDIMNIKIGKAGRNRLKGRRPTVRGKAKNAVDHPHGGGEGGASIGMPHPKTPWGMPALGYRSRNRKKKSAKLIIKRRSK